MTVTLTYDNDNARVRIAATGLAAANFATVERSVDQIVWTTCRGGLNVPVTAGSLTTTFDDYEFIPNRTNFYRVRGISTAAISLVGSQSTSAANGPLTMALPGGTIAGDVVYIWASSRITSATVNTPAGWTQLVASANTALLGRVYDGVWTMPSVTFAGDTLNEDTITQAWTFRNAALNPSTFAILAGSGQNIATPALTVPSAKALILALGWKQDDWTSITPLAGFTTGLDTVSIAGNDAAEFREYQVQTTAANIPASTVTVTGGASALTRCLVAAFAPAAFLNEQIASTAAPLDRVWLKSVTRPFLNRAITTVDPGDPGRKARGGTFDAVGRTNPIATTEVRGAASFAVQVYTATDGDEQTLDYILASGDVLFLHTPLGCEVPTAYVQVGDTSSRRSRPRSEARVFTLPCEVVSPPGPDIVYAISTWASVLASYATWADVIAANPTWADLLARLGNPSEVIVG